VADNSKSWQIIDILIKTLYPFIVASVTWTGLQVVGHGNRLTAVESKYVVERDLRELEVRWQTKMESLQSLLHGIDRKVTEIQGQLKAHGNTGS
jgi:anthranilate phosphoribosyltransferase